MGPILPETSARIHMSRFYIKLMANIHQIGDKSTRVMLERYMCGEAVRQVSPGGSTVLRAIIFSSLVAGLGMNECVYIYNSPGFAVYIGQVLDIATVQFHVESSPSLQRSMFTSRGSKLFTRSFYHSHFVGC